MENELKEYSTFLVEDKNGNQIEMAVLVEFEVDHKTYVAASEVVGDAISEEGVYIYRAKLSDDEIVAEKITDAKEYENVINAYMELEV